MPTPTNVDVSVVDSDGTGLSGASVQSEGSTGNGTGQLSDGTPTIIQLSDYYPTCTTDSSGECSIPDLVGIPLSIYANYSPQPGDTSYPTFSGSTTTPVDTDPSAATVTISNLADVTSAGTEAGSVVVASPGSTSLTDASSSSVPSQSLPPRLSAPVGAVGYQVHDVPVGGSIDVYLTLPPGTVPTQIDKLQNGQLIDVSSVSRRSPETW